MSEINEQGNHGNTDSTLCREPENSLPIPVHLRHLCPLQQSRLHNMRQLLLESFPEFSSSSPGHLLDSFTLLQCISFSLRDNWPTEITLKRGFTGSNVIIIIYFFTYTQLSAPPQKNQIDRMQRQPAAARRGYDVTPIYLHPSRPG